MYPTAPFIISTPPECAFYRTLGGVAADWVADADAYDARGLRLSMTRQGLVVTSVEPEELARLLRRWLGHVDALRESTASWPLWLLVHAAVEHAGYALSPRTDGLPRHPQTRPSALSETTISIDDPDDPRPCAPRPS